MLVYLGDGTAPTVLCAATLILKVQIKLAISNSHGMLTLGQPVPALTCKNQVPDSVSTRVPISSHWYDATRTMIFSGKAVCWLLACLTSQQQASVSQGRICSGSCTCCHTEIEIADQTLQHTQSQYTDTRPTSPSADPITPGALQDVHWSANFYVTGVTRTSKIQARAGIEPNV